VNKISRALIIQCALVLAATISFILSIWQILTERQKFQWDLTVYYNGPLEFARGLDPYKVSHFVYPPIYLPIFKAFSTWFSYEQFYSVFLIAKIVCFLGLLLIWKRNFFAKVPLGTFLLFAWLGLYATFLVDFQAGNISVFETTLLFLAFVSFLKKRPRLFAVLILCAASLKMTPLFFLILLPLSSRQNWKVFFLGCLGFLLYGALNYVMYPEFTRTFITEALSRTGESGFVCPSSLAFITDAWIHLLSRWEFLPANGIAKITYLTMAIFILWQSAKSWNEAKGSECRSSQDRNFLIFFSILVFTLTMPRMKDYAYMIAIPSLLYAVYEFDFQIPRWILFLPLILIPPTTTWPPFFQEAFREFWSYYPLFLAALFWYFYLGQLSRTGLPRPNRPRPNQKK
jgi:hypothetical protein